MIILDIEMPKNCAECPFHKEGVAKTICSLTDNGVGVAVSCYERMKDCPIKCEVEDIKAEIIDKYDDCDICEYFEDYDYDENDISEYRSVGDISDIINIIEKHTGV